MQAHQAHVITIDKFTKHNVNLCDISGECVSCFRIYVRTIAHAPNIKTLPHLQHNNTLIIQDMCLQVSLFHDDNQKHGKLSNCGTFTSWKQFNLITNTDRARHQLGNCFSKYIPRSMMWNDDRLLLT